MRYKSLIAFITLNAARSPKAYEQKARNNSYLNLQIVREIVRSLHFDPFC
jgi:hypothetical protein